MADELTIDRRGGFTIADFDPLFSGKHPLPNFERMDLGPGVSTLACASGLDVIPGVRHAREPGMTDAYAPWARYFLNRTQGGQLDGTGYVMIYGNGGGKIGHFAICKHEKIAEVGADPRRGWHPGRCRLCNLNMTVDSGD